MAVNTLCVHLSKGAQRVLNVHNDFGISTYFTHDYEMHSQLCRKLKKREEKTKKKRKKRKKRRPVQLSTTQTAGRSE